jgi:hypothetical protein
MKLLIDTDVFCKLGMTDLLAESAELFGANLEECARLPALPYMLRKGTLRRHYGDDVCDRLLLLADLIPAVGAASSEWLDKLVAVESIDAGEAQLISVAAEHRILLMSSDKRALRALSAVADIRDPLAGRVCVFEAVLLALVERYGVDEIRKRVAALSGKDKMVRMCFSSGGSDPREGLFSYLRSIADDVSPLILWTPQGGGSR